VRGEKNAAGQPLLDTRTVELLVAHGVGRDTAAVEALLLKNQSNGSRYPLETAEPALTWLAAALEGCSKQDKGSAEAVAGVTLVVRKYPALLYHGVSTLQRKWDFLQAPVPAGLGFSREQACAAVMSLPQLLGLTPAHMLQSATALAELGVADAPAALARMPSLFSLASDTLRAKADVLRHHGLDAGGVISAYPGVLSRSVDHLNTKLRWLLHVAGCDTAEVQTNTVLLGYSLPERMRPRFFLALQLGVAGRCKLKTCMSPTDAKFVTHVLRVRPRHLGAWSSTSSTLSRPSLRASWTARRRRCWRSTPLPADE
jgi:hypothetical protein